MREVEVLHSHSGGDQEEKVVGLAVHRKTPCTSRLDFCDLDLNICASEPHVLPPPSLKTL